MGLAATGSAVLRGTQLPVGEAAVGVSGSDTRILTKTSSVSDAARMYRTAALLAILHAGFSIILWKLGLLRCYGRWSDFWQILDYRFLQDDLLQNLWYLHGQPPLYNLYLGTLFQVFSPDVRIYVGANIVLAASTVAMVYVLARWMEIGTVMRRVLMLVVILHPALYVYEHYELYSVFTAFLIVLSITALAWWSRSQSRSALFLSLLGLALLIGSRSMYQLPLLLLPLSVLLLQPAAKTRRLTLVACALACVVVSGLYVKNSLQFGFFGTSSWYGISMYKVVNGGYHTEAKDMQAAEHCVTAHAAFSRPSVYRSCGFSEETAIPVLNQDDQNNVNVPDISRAYFSAAKSRVLADPAAALVHVGEMAVLWFMPSSLPQSWAPEPWKSPAFSAYEARFYGVLGGRYLLKPFGVHSYLMLSYLIVVLLFLYRVTGIVRRWRSGRITEKEFIILLAVFLVGYNFVISSIGEYGENNRFKFDVEFLFLLVAFESIEYGWNELKSQLHRRSAP
ncbi:MAG: hypothetical protein RRA94_07385 [Bacteroidota bacterium]|nr:hypothetical protein [Bacteroidota bacterium]